jgi:hypothetical protein
VEVPALFPGVQAAIDDAEDGEEIVLALGTYRECLQIRGKDLVLRSVAPRNPMTVRTTILDGANEGRVLSLDSRRTSRTRIMGLTVMRGKANWFHENLFRPGDGGGIDGGGSVATIENCRFLNNAAHGVSMDGAYPRGAAIGNANGLIRNNLFVNNTLILDGVLAESLDGSAISNCTGVIVNNTFYHNSGTGGANPLDAGEAEVANNLIYPQGSAEDPRFLDSENGDFRLLPDSPYVDAGVFTTDAPMDFEGDRRPQDGTPEVRGDGSDFDVGADEYQPETLEGVLILRSLLGKQETFAEADRNLDGVVDCADWIGWVLERQTGSE